MILLSCTDPITIRWSRSLAVPADVLTEARNGDGFSVYQPVARAGTTFELDADGKRVQVQLCYGGETELDFASIDALDAKQEGDPSPDSKPEMAAATEGQEPVQTDSPPVLDRSSLQLGAPR